MHYVATGHTKNPQETHLCFNGRLMIFLYPWQGRTDAIYFDHRYSSFLFTLGIFCYHRTKVNHIVF